MSSDREPERPEWERVKAIVGEALERPESERGEYVADACGDDPILRDEVLSLLNAADGTDGLPGRPVLDEALRILAAGAPDPWTEGGSIGPYRILRELGRGGMGTVYLAERDDPELKVPVALKVLHGVPDSREVVERFKRERDLLARLNHPYVAKIFDAGTSEGGAPFFAMEYVEGERIDRFCNDRQLTVDERLDLFRKVCAAVHYAHRNLIVHRDLKPGNVLVTDTHTPKLLDFGIAKLLQDDAPEGELTVTELRALTPGYASPEQVLGQPITTASDIYSLGVLLYALLTDHIPFESSRESISATVDALSNKDPAPPATVLPEAPVDGSEAIARARSVSLPALRRRLSGDLETIALTALRREPEERYSSALALAADIEREQQRLPVAARPASLRYRAVRFVRRHWVGVAAATAVLLATGFGVGATIWQARIAEHERDLAERRFAELRQLAHAVLFELHDAIETLPGSTAARELLVGRALEYLDRLHLEVGDDPELLAELATGYERIGEVQGAIFRSNLGRPEEALASYRTSLALRQRRLDLEPRNPVAMIDLARSLTWIGDQILGASGDTSEALTYYDRARAALVPLTTAEGVDQEALGRLRVVQQRLAYALLEAGRPAEAIALLESCLAIALELREGGLAEIDHLKNVAYDRINMARALGESGELPAAIEAIREARTAAESALALGLDAEAEVLLAVSGRELGGYLTAAGRAAEAVPLLERSIAQLQQILAAEPDNAQNTEHLGVTLDRLGDAWVHSGDLAAGLALNQQVLGMAESLLAQVGESAELERYMVGELQRIADAHRVLGDTKTAGESYRRSIEIGERLVVDDPAHALTRRDLAFSLLKYAQLQAGLNRCTEASRLFAGGLEHWTEASRLGVRVATGFHSPGAFLAEPPCDP